MDITVVTILIVILIFLLLASGLWIGVMLGIIGVLSLYFFVEGSPIKLIAIATFNGTNSFAFTAAPLFILMGEILMQCRLSERLYGGISPLLSRVPGGLLHSNIFSSAIFAAMCGSSFATCATIGTVAVPALKERHYDTRMSLGSLAAAATLGMMIPPSVPMIVYGAMCGVSVGKLFMGGIIPGIIIVFLFSSFIIIYHVFFKKTVGEKSSIGEMLRGIRGIWPILLLIFMVLGTIYLGVCTPTESAALGCSGALIIGLALRQVTYQNLKMALVESMKITSMMMFIFIGAMIFQQCVSVLGITASFTKLIVGLNLSPWLVVVAVSLMYIILGCFLEGVSLMLTTVPILFPMMMALGFDPVWFGVMMILYIEFGFITPPIGMNLYVLSGISGVPIEEVARGVIPFFFLLVVALAILTIFPEVILFLPSTM